MRAERVYLDHAATSPLRPAAKAAMLEAMDVIGNPSSVHYEGRATKKRLEEAREAIALFVGCTPKQVIFTSGATEANNWVLSARWHRRFVGSGEHASILEVADANGAERVTLSAEGMVPGKELESQLGAAGEGSLVSIQWVNNETGIVQDIEALAAQTHAAGAFFHTDAVQAAGKVPLDFAVIGADFMSLSAHKIGGPPGVGALIAKDESLLASMILGGGQERRKRAGTENLPAIAGFAAAAGEAASEIEQMPDRQAWQAAFEAKLKSEIPDMVLFGEEVVRVPTITNFAIPGISAESLVIALDLSGFAVSAGSACSSGKVTPSHVVAAMGYPEDVARSAVRVSMGWVSTERDLIQFADALIKQVTRMPKTGAPASTLTEMRV